MGKDSKQTTGVSSAGSTVTSSQNATSTDAGPIKDISINSQEFHKWLQDSKSKDANSLSEMKLEKLFKKFRKWWQARTIPSVSNKAAETSTTHSASSDKPLSMEEEEEEAGGSALSKKRKKKVGPTVDTHNQIEPDAYKEERKRAKKRKKELDREASEACSADASQEHQAAKSRASDSSGTSAEQPPKGGEKGTAHSDSQNDNNNNVTILLFYAYCPAQMTRGQQDAAITFCYGKLNQLGMTGRLRVGREGYNCTLTGTRDSVREFTKALREFDPSTFGSTDFKYVDGQPTNQLLKGLKVWPVTEIVTYGFDPQDAPLDQRGTHLTPQEFHEAMMDPNTVVIDVRNFNETAIGRFAPKKVLESRTLTHQPGTRDSAEQEVVESADTQEKKKKKKDKKDKKRHKEEDEEEEESGGVASVTTKNITGNSSSEIGATVLDPCMRRSTEFPGWVQEHKHEFEGKRVLMYCTAGVRCERASAFLKNQGVQNVFQLEGGIHRYLDAFPDDGGFWVGKNYTFDKRFSHGAHKAEVVSHCVHCAEPWERYQAQAKCCRCSMEVLLCRTCQRLKPAVPKSKLVCALCRPPPTRSIAGDALTSSSTGSFTAKAK